MSSREKPSEFVVWCGKNTRGNEKVDVRIFAEFFQVSATAA